MINAQQLRDYVIIPACSEVDGLYSLSAEILLLATCAHESRMGHFLAQSPVGPALGIFQMEPATWRDNWSWLKRRLHLKEAAIRFGGAEPCAEDMVYNLRFAAFMARIHYWRRPQSLPSPEDVDGMWLYYKRYYNTILGAAREEDFMAAFNRHVAPIYRNERISFA